MTRTKSLGVSRRIRAIAHTLRRTGSAWAGNTGEGVMTDDNFHKLALSESFERVAKVAEERAAFNEQMREKETNMMTPVTQDDRNAAAALYLKNMGEPSSLHDKSTAAEIEMGMHDDWDCVQAFAAHRLRAALEARGLEIREKGQ